MPLSKCRNQLLLALSSSDRALLEPGLVPVELKLHQQIETAYAPIESIYFPDEGVISVVAGPKRDQIEAGVVGREGMSGVAVVLSNHLSPNEAYVQIAGSAHRIGAEDLRAALDASKSLCQVLQRYAQVFMVQIAQTAFANGTAKIENRLARWLLMAHDRQDDNEVRLTHEFLSIMLGVRRPGVTEALHLLESKRLIQTSRGAISILNRKGLMLAAGDIYGVPEAEYQRLLGAPLGA